MTLRPLLLLAVCLALGACGSRVALKPLPGMSAVPKAAAADNPPTAEQLMTPSSQARPERQVDLLTKSVERPDDPFETPPGADNGK